VSIKGPINPDPESWLARVQRARKAYHAHLKTCMICDMSPNARIGTTHAQRLCDRGRELFEAWMGI